jgi:hypothetical protein
MNYSLPRNALRLVSATVLMGAQAVVIAGAQQGASPPKGEERPWWYIVVAAIFVALIRNIPNVQFHVPRAESHVPLLGRADQRVKSFLRRIPWKTLLYEYVLLFAAALILAWVLGIVNLNHPARFLPRVAALPVAIILLEYCFKRFLKVPR